VAAGFLGGMRQCGLDLRLALTSGGDVGGFMWSSHDALSAVHGKALERVRYVVLPDSPEADERLSRSADEAEHAVELVFGGVFLGLVWQMESELECLRVVQQDMAEIATSYSKSNRRIELFGMAGSCRKEIGGISFLHA
jgi:hypothetical protein